MAQAQLARTTTDSRAAARSFASLKDDEGGRARAAVPVCLVVTARKLVASRGRRAVTHSPAAARHGITQNMAAEPPVLSPASDICVELIDPSRPALRRVASRWEIVAFSINDVIGSGVYLLPAAAAAILGGASVWAVVLAGAAVALLVLCFAEASSYFDRAGGAYLYTRTAFGHLVGFEVGWMTWIARIASVASLSVGFAQALSYFWPAVSGGWARGAAVALPLAVLTLI